MAINFFDTQCITLISDKIFGIYDIPPATVDTNNDEQWIAWVDNPKEIEITFIAVDKCLNIPYSEGDRCEAIISYNENLTFIELKDRDGGRWAGKSRDQLVNTIALFKRDVGLERYTKLSAHIANKQRPNFFAGGMNFYQQFEDETGFILRVGNVIKID